MNLDMCPQFAVVAEREREREEGRKEKQSKWISPLATLLKIIAPICYVLAWAMS